MQYGLLFGVKDTVHIAEKKSPHKPIVVIVFLVLLSFCFLLLYVSCVFYTK